MIYNNVNKVYGPYKSKQDKRERIVLHFTDKSVKVVSYPKYLMELHLNRYLDKDETVDHIDGNYLNNDISNLQILDRRVHATLDVFRNQDVEVNCTYCNKSFIIKGSKIHNSNRKHKSGYFCSKTCSGKYGVEIQQGKRDHVIKSKIIPTKFKLKDLSIKEEIPCMNGVNSEKGSRLK